MRSRLLHYRASWWLNLLSGTGWFQIVFAQPFDLERAEAEIRRVILETPGAVRLISFTADFIAQTRAFTVRFELQTDFGPSGEVVVSA